MDIGHYLLGVCSGILISSKEQIQVKSFIVSDQASQHSAGNQTSDPSKIVKPIPWDQIRKEYVCTSL